MDTETKAGAAFEAKRRQRARDLAQAKADREEQLMREAMPGYRKSAMPQPSARAKRLLALFGEQK